MIPFLLSDGSVTCAVNGGFRTHLPLPPVETIDAIKDSLAAFVPVHIKYPAARIICRSNVISSKCEVRLLPASRRLLIYTNAHAGFMLDMSKALSVSVRARKAKLMRIRISFKFGRVQLIFPEHYGRWTLGILAAHEPGRALPEEKVQRTGGNGGQKRSVEMEVVPWGKGVEPTKFQFDEVSVTEVTTESVKSESFSVYMKEFSLRRMSVTTDASGTRSCLSIVESTQIQSETTQSHHQSTFISTMTVRTTSMSQIMETQKSDSLISMISDDSETSFPSLHTAKDSESASEREPKSLKSPASIISEKPRFSMKSFKSTSSRLPQWPPPPSAARESDSEADSDTETTDLAEPAVLKLNHADRMLRRPTKDRFCPKPTESVVEAGNFKQDWDMEDDALSLKSNASTRCFFYNLDRATATGENNAAHVDPSAFANTVYSTGPMKSFNCLSAIRDKMDSYVVPQLPEFTDSTSAWPSSPGSPGVETTHKVPPIEPVSPSPSNTSTATGIALTECVEESFV